MKIALIAHDKKKSEIIELAKNIKIYWRIMSYMQQVPQAP